MSQDYPQVDPFFDMFETWNTVQTDYGSLIGTRVNQMEQCLESTEDGAKLPIRVFSNIF